MSISYSLIPFPSLIHVFPVSLMEIYEQELSPDSIARLNRCLPIMNVTRERYETVTV